MLKQQLQQKLQQKLSPAQIQVIKMLEIPSLELEERIRQELEDNPVLEEGSDPAEGEYDDLNEQTNDEDGNNDDFDAEEYVIDDDIPDYKQKINNTSKDDKYEEIPFSIGMTFHEYLASQLGLVHLSPHEMLLAEYVIGNIDEEGYLRRTPESMVDDIVFQTGTNATDEEMLSVINVVRSLDPAGVCATTLQDCLLLQLERKTQTEDIVIAKKILENYFDEFSKKHYEKITRSLEIDDETLSRVIAEIVRLNPKPGNAWSGDVLEKSMSVIVPDFILENDDGRLLVHLNNANVPELHVNNSYNDMFKSYAANKKNQSREMKDAVLFVKQKIDAAKWFIDAIKQRHQTLLSTMTAIVEFQREFFIEGDDRYLKPMILEDIAEVTGFDVSTVSRVSKSKYIQTEFGIFPLKYFFSESMTNEQGVEVSTREIKQIMQDCIDNENKRKPLNDDLLAQTLKTHGYNIARRTVAKYREQLNIPVARLRKEI